MADKKNSPDGKSRFWKNAPWEKEHSRTYHVKDADPGSDPVAALDDLSPDLEPAPEAPVHEEIVYEEPVEPPVSQAVLDIKEAGMTPEEAATASQTIAAEQEKKVKKSEGREGLEKLVTIARFRWILLLILSLAAVLAWAVDAQYSAKPYHWPAWGLLLLTLIITVGTGRFFRLPTRAGIAALAWSLTYVVGALYGPSETIFREIPAALPWAGLLTLIMIWVLVAIWRKLGRYKVVDIILGLVVVYALLGPVWALVDSITSGQAMQFKFSLLSASPRMITDHLPWFLWPMTVALLVVLPLAVFFALWDQFSALRRRGARHGGNFFLALAFLALFPYGFLSFDRAVTEEPEMVAFMRQVYSPAREYARETQGMPALSPARPSETPGLDPVDRPTEESVLPKMEPIPAPAVVTVPAPPATIEPEPPKPSPLRPLESAPASPAPAPFIEGEDDSEIREVQPQAVEPAPAPLAEPESPPRPKPDPAVQILEERLTNTEMKLTEALTRINELEERLMQQQDSSVKPDPNPMTEPNRETAPAPEIAPAPAPEEAPPVQAQPTTGNTSFQHLSFLIV